LFIASELTYQGQKLELSTQFPNDGKVGISIKSGPTKAYEMAIRHPGWASGNLDIMVNGKVIEKSLKPSSYVVINRKWKSGDKIEFTLPMNLHSEAMPDNPKRAALMYGPLVLAADLTTTNKAKRDSIEVERFPVLVTNNKPVADWVTKENGKLEFRTQGSARPSDITLRPFYQLHRERYAVYLDEFTDSEWAAAEATYREEEERRKDLIARTVDNVRIGEMQPERDHNLTSEKNDVRGSDGKNFRSPLSDGWFQIDMKLEPTSRLELVVTYWGNERMRPDFQILVDGKMIAAETLKGKPMNQFFEVVYPIPLNITEGKSMAVIRVQANPGKTGASVSGIRLVKAKS
jgi:hypothetical protein